MPHYDPCVARVPIFQGLDPQQQTEVADFARPAHFEKGDQVVGVGDKSRRLLVVHSGTVRVVHLLESGREHVVRVLTEGDVLGEEAFILGRPPTHFAFADEASSMCTFDHDDLAVELPMAKKDVASHLGTTPETLSRKLRGLSKAGILTLQGRRGILIRDIDALLDHSTAT